MRLEPMLVPSIVFSVLSVALSAATFYANIGILSGLFGVCAVGFGIVAILQAVERRSASLAYREGES